MKIGAMFPSHYLKAMDVEGGKTFTIQDVSMQEFKSRDGQTEMKPIVFFKEDKRGLVLNKTNSKLIARVLESDDTDDWAGKAITLYSAEVEFAGDLVDSIRVKGKKPAANTVADEGPEDVFGDEDVPF
jgi:hypothetical protein